MGPYDAAGSAEQVNAITAKRIQQLHGGPSEEMRNHRRAMLALFVIVSKKAIPGMLARESLEVGDQLLALNTKTEEIIAQGRAYKKSKGW